MALPEEYATTRTTEYRHTVIGYRYSSPPQPITPPRSRIPKTKGACFCGICICSVSFTVTFCIIYSLVWVIVQPQLPQFKIASVYIPLLNTTNPGTLPTWEISFNVRNPNKHMKFSYNTLDVIVYSYDYYTSDSLCETEIPPFYQGTKNEAVVVAKFPYVQNSSVWYMSEQLDNGVVSLNIGVLGGIGAKPNPYLLNTNVKVECTDVKVGFTDNTRVGSLMGVNTLCKVEIVAS